jgi:hypothetical protein
MKNTRKILSYKQGSERFLREKNTTIFLVNKKNFTPSCIKKRKTLPLP